MVLPENQEFQNDAPRQVKLSDEEYYNEMNLKHLPFS
jgi:hypothetical protein